MSKTHNWFATSEDLLLILDWLREAKAEFVDISPFPAELPCDGRELVLHFPAIGPLEYWPDDIHLSDYPENSPRWRQAVLLRGRSDKNRRQVDADRSAVAGLQLPELREGRYWVSGSLWFPGSKLRETFPELARLASRFERRLRKFPLVFDNTKGFNQTSYNRQLCAGGVIHRIYALPAAEALLKEGAFMVDYWASPTAFDDFKHLLRSRGMIP